MKCRRRCTLLLCVGVVIAASQLVVYYLHTSNDRTAHGDPKSFRQLFSDSDKQKNGQTEDFTGKSPLPLACVLSEQDRFPNHVEILQDQILQRFIPVMEDHNLCRILAALKAIHETLTQANITYFMHAGTLLGSWRHHGIIPWDDDADLFLNASQKTDAIAAIRSLAPTFAVAKKGNNHKVFVNNMQKETQRLEEKTLSWPYVDLFFFEENATHIFFCGNEFLKNMIVPLHLRPFHSFQLYAPRDVMSTFQVRKDEVSNCSFSRWDHKTGLGRAKDQSANIDCKRLEGVFPFVQRQPGPKGHGCNETLKLGDKVLSTFLADFHC